MLKHLFTLLILALGVAWTGGVWAELPNQSPLQVITLNTGLAKAIGRFGVVRYTYERLMLQPGEIEKILRPPFVLNLQEFLGNKQAERVYRDWARKNGFYVSAVDPTSNGLMTISSEPIVRFAFSKFSQSAIGRPFGVLGSIINFQGTEIAMLNTHTVYSDTYAVNPIHQIQLHELAWLTFDFFDVPTIMAGDFNGGEDINSEDGKFDLVKELWVPFLKNVNPSWSWANSKIISGKKTWDKLNPLVKYPAQILNIFRATKKEGGWGYPSSTIDHIGANDFFEFVQADVELDHPIVLPVKNPKKSDGKSKPQEPKIIRLSDHSACVALLIMKRPISVLGL